jgi:hypothetical protein
MRYFLKVALALALLIFFGCKTTSSQRATASSVDRKALSNSYAWGRIVADSKTRVLSMGLRRDDLDSCKIALEETGHGQYRCTLYNPLVKPGATGELINKEKEFVVLNNTEVNEKIIVRALVDQLQMDVSAGSKGRAMDILDLVPQHMDKLRLVKFNVETSQGVME